ncbi:MAG: APC family permease [Campylobacterales bacterium]
MQDSKKSIGLPGAIAIGIGGMVGGGIFAVLGEAVSLSHGATPLAFGFGGLVALLTAFSYARLSVAFPGRGGTVTFIDRAFGNNLASGSVNLMLWLSYLVTIALYAVAFASYAQTFFPSGSPLLRHALISLAIVLPTLINLVSASFVSRSETFIVAMKLILLAVIIVFSLPYVRSDHFDPAHWGPLFSVVAAGMIIFVAYEGFELIANAAEDIEAPERNLPRAFLGSVLIVIALYVLIAAVTVSTVPEDALVHAKDYALAVAAKPALGQTGFTLVAVAALLATFSAINATIYGNARLGYTLAKDGRLPEGGPDDRQHDRPDRDRHQRQRRFSVDLHPRKRRGAKTRCADRGQQDTASHCPASQRRRAGRAALPHLGGEHSCRHDLWHLRRDLGHFRSPLRTMGTGTLS